jgi:hypothetical protein
MTHQTNSRFITHPSIEPKSPNSHTVLIIDADTDDVINIGMFCKVSAKNYDVYLYKQDIDDSSWLNDINDNLDCTLVKDTNNLQVNNLLDYFQNFDATPQEV